MGFLTAIRRMIKLILDHSFSFITALTLCQLPQFMTQYQDALAGAHFEAEKSVVAIRERAERNGKTLDEFIGKHLINPDTDFKASGELMRAEVERERQYRLALNELKNAAVWLRPIVFVKHYEHALAKKIDFKPALPLTLEAAVYALLGILLGMGIFRLLVVALRWIFPSGKKKYTAPDLSLGR